MKINIDTDILLKQKLSIEEYVVSFMINNKKDGFFQLARYARMFPVSEETVKKIEDRGLVKFKKDLGKDGLYSIFSIEASSDFDELISTEHLSSWIQEWVDLWPKGIQSGGYRIRPSLNEAQAKMKRFCNIHPEYSKETIIEATKNYIDRFSIKGYNYIKLGKYFIFKDNESTLADECEAAIEDLSDVHIKQPSYGEQEL